MFLEISPVCEGCPFLASALKNAELSEKQCVKKCSMDRSSEYIEASIVSLGCEAINSCSLEITPSRIVSDLGKLMTNSGSGTVHLSRRENL